MEVVRKVNEIGFEIEKDIRKAIKGDRQAFTKVINLNIDYLYKIAFMHLKNEEKALEAIQECSYRAFLNIKKINNPQYFKSWITRILINICIDEIRKDKKVLQLNLDIEKINEESEITIEEKLDLYNAIDKLSVEYKTVVILKYFNDLSVEEIGEITNVPINTVKTRLSRARKKLKYLLKEEA